MVVAGTAAAIFPDLDFVLGWISELTYLRGHRGVTHSLILLPLWGLLIAWLLARFWQRGGLAGAGWRSFYLVVCSALFRHILGDLITQFGTMILAPFSDQRFGWGTTFIIDLPFTGIIVAGLLASALWRSSRVPAATALVLAGWVGVQAMGRAEAIDAARAYAAANGIKAVEVVSPRRAGLALQLDRDRVRRRALPLRPHQHPAQRAARRHRGRQLHPPLLRALYAVGDGAVGGARALRQRQHARARRAGVERGGLCLLPLVRDVPGAGPRRRGGRRPGVRQLRDLRFLTPGRDRQPFIYGLCNAAGGWRLFEREAGGLRWIDPR